MKPTDSETTGEPRAQADKKPIGMQLGEIGSESLPMIAPRAEVSAWLAERTPGQVDQEMASLVRRFGVRLTEETRTLYPASGGFRTELVEIHCHGEPLTEEQANRLHGFFTPAEDAQIERWVAELSVITAKRADDDMSETLRLHAYTRRLEDYPADVVKAVLLTEMWKFFPTWAELHEKLEARMKTRRALYRSAQNALPLKPAKVIRLPTYRDPPKPEERGPLPFIPDPTPAVQSVSDLREELTILEADKELAGTSYGQAYAQSLIQRIAELEAPRAVNTNTTKEAG